MRIRDNFPVQFRKTDSRQHREKKENKPCCQELHLSRTSDPEKERNAGNHE